MKSPTKLFLQTLAGPYYLMKYFKNNFFQILVGFISFGFIIPACNRILLIKVRLPRLMSQACVDIKDINKEIGEEMITIEDNKGYIHEALWEHFDIEVKEEIFKVISLCAGDFNSESVEIYGQSTQKILAGFTEEEGFYVKD